MSDQHDIESRLAALEARVLELESDRTIREVLARYGFAWDTCNDDAYVNLFTDDAVIDGTTGGGTVRRGGKEQIRELICNRPGSQQAPALYGNSMFVQGNNLVTHIEGEEAVVNSYSIVLKGENGGVELESAGNNQWRLKKVGNRWLIHERRRRQIGGESYTTNLDATPE